MRELFLYITFVFFSFTTLHAQSRSVKVIDSIDQVLEIKMPDTSNNSLFVNNLDLEDIVIGYKDKVPYFAFLTFEKDKNSNYGRREYYDLAFEGDAYVFEQKYGHINFIVPKANIGSVDGIKKENSVFGLVGLSIYKDTISYRFRQRLSNMKLKGYNPDWIVGTPAKFKGELRLVEEKLVKQLSTIEHSADIDSTIVFRAKISRVGSLSEMDLIAGKQSVFSDLVQKEFVPPKTEFDLLPPRADWNAAGIDAGPKETKIKIYARLNLDGSITIRTPRRLRTFSGE